MRVQPILEFKGVRIELDVAEALAIANGKDGGAARVQQEIAMLVNVHYGQHSPAPDGIAVGPMLRSMMLGEPPEDPPPARARPAEPRVTCDWCSEPFRGLKGLARHRRYCSKRPLATAAEPDKQPNPGAPSSTAPRCEWCDKPFFKAADVARHKRFCDKRPIGTKPLPS
jgi:hypothetical protein